MAELTEKDRANLYKMAQALEADLVKKGYKKGTSAFEKRFAERVKGIHLAGRNVSEIGKIMRSRPAPVKTTKKAAAKPAAPAGGRGASPDRPVRRRGASTATGSSNQNRGGGLGALNSAPNGLPLRSVPRLNVPASVATPDQLRTPTTVKSGGPGRTPRPSGPASAKPARQSRPASQKAQPRSTTPKAAPKSTTPKAAPKPAPKPSSSTRSTRTVRGTGVGARGNIGGVGGRARGGGPRRSGR